LGDSDGDWGDLVAHDDGLAAQWDGYERLPDPGENDALDAFCAAKRIDIPSLVRLGAKLSAPTVLAFAFPGGLKYRAVESGQRWAAAGSEWTRLKIVRAGVEQSDTVIVAEGETDAARLTMLYSVDVAVLPAGAKGIRPEYGEQLAPYQRVLLGLDNDEAGDAGCAKLAALLPHAQRFGPPGVVDWCALDPNDGAPPLPDPPERMPLLVSAGELMSIEYPECASWFEGALLPIGGQMVEHGWAKSFKSYLALDILACIAQGLPWCGFEPTEEPAKVAVVQFEIPPKFYRDRVESIRCGAREPDLFDRNFLTWTPQTRPQIKAGNKEQEAFMRAELVRAGVQVVLMDPVRRLMKAGSSMNDEDSVRYPLAFFESLQNEGITVIFTHHDNKGSAKSGGGDALDMTGSGAWAGDADSILSVSLPKGVRREDPTRNLHFLLRNGPSPTPRGFRLCDNGTITYQNDPFGPEEDSDDPRI
jgi:hypothetical protein